MSQAARHQAAGHPGTLTMEGGALFIKSTTKQEIDFYTELTKKDEDSVTTMGGRLLDWLPPFMGSLTEGNLKDTSPATPSDSATSTPNEYIVLQNLYHGFSFPSILDIKLGSKLTDDTSTDPAKIARLQKVSQETTSGSLSFRICGMKLYDGDENDPKPIFSNMESTVQRTKDGSHTYLEFDKIFGRSLTKETVVSGLELYFSHYFQNRPQGDEIILLLLGSFLKRLQLLYNCLLDYEVRIFSGSLLFMFENDLSRWNLDKYEDLDPLVREPVIPLDDDEDDEDEETGDAPPTQIPLSGLNMIDMAHAKFAQGQGHDENIIQGVENLIDIFTELIERKNRALA